MEANPSTSPDLSAEHWKRRTAPRRMEGLVITPVICKSHIDNKLGKPDAGAFAGRVFG